MLDGSRPHGAAETISTQLAEPSIATSIAVGIATIPEARRVSLHHLPPGGKRRTRRQSAGAMSNAPTSIFANQPAQCEAQRRFPLVRRNTPGDRPTGTCAGCEW
jgi:hypothetical protein